VHWNRSEWDSSIAAVERAVRFNPRATNLLQLLGDTYHLLHRYPEAVATYRTELVMAPDLVQPHISLGWSYLLSSGRTDTLRAALRGVPLDADPELGAGSVLNERMALAMLEGHSDSVLMLVRGSKQRLRVLDHYYWTIPSYRRLGDTAAVRATVDSLAMLADSALRASPDDPRMRELRATTAALRGHGREAQRETKELLSWFREHRSRDDKWRVTRVRLLMMTGQLDSAFAELEPLVAGPSLTTVHYLRLDPWWDQITRDPRFDALFAKYAGR
jgi:tetratricopeptide (TPR) repeat protein